MMYQDKQPINELYLSLIDQEDSDDYLEHYGTKRHSGRYPWGSGEDPYQHSGDFLARVNDLKKQGLSEAEIAKTMGLSTTELRTQKSLANDERKMNEYARARSLQEDGLGYSEIGRIMGKPESSIRNMLKNEDYTVKASAAKNTADILKKHVDEKGMVDVGTGVELELGVSREMLKQAFNVLQRDGYELYGVGIPQVTNPGKQINAQVLCSPGTEYKDVYANMGKIQPINDYHSNDGGETFYKFEYPKSMDPKRLQIRYSEEGGDDKDGVIELRRGVEDLSLGKSRYAQVRILVDGDRYLKGMAVYSDDMPDGVDVIFNTNKSKGTPMRDVLKKIKEDKDNPFGSSIKASGQYHYLDANGKEQLGLVNKCREEGDWSEWGKKLPSQFLGKQPIALAKQQLKMSIDDKKIELDEIMALDNPTIKRRLLQSFADDCDAASVHLKAAALPRQSNKVILPLQSIKDTEIYAPDYNNGEKVALIRYPHAGTFEIPVLTVNNKNKEANRIFKNALDAVGINKKVADQLSGADFDGDTVMVIPTNDKIKIKSSKPLDDLKGFDPKIAYATVEKNGIYYNSKGVKVKIMPKEQKGNEMGRISNLITDMTLKGADEQELARAVKHSMVVIDAEKHKLDYHQSEKDNGIAELKKKYQGHINEDGKYSEGVSTLLSKAKSPVQVLKRKGSPRIDPETGEVYYQEVTETYVDKNGKTKTRTIESTRMAETKDARTLSSGTRMEELYADYANRLKAMANEARKTMINTPRLEYNSDANKMYKEEVKSLDAKLLLAKKNAPKERIAQAIANDEVKTKKQANPNMEKDELKKVKQQALTRARDKVGAKRYPITMTDKEWKAIQSGAISDTKLTDIMKYADMDDLKKRSTPRTSNSLSQAKISKINQMKASGYTIAEIANSVGVSTSTVSKYL